MTRITTQLLLLALACTTLTTSAWAETGAQFAAPGIRAPKDPDVNGVRFSILHGKNNTMHGLDLGLLSLSETGTFSGVGFVLGIGKVNGNMTGGAHFSLVNMHAGKDSGLNAAFINLVNNADNAVDFGFVNIAKGTTMLDIGGLNLTKRSTAQLGFINVTDEITGFQLGFINIAKNGFLPIFPFFNFPVNEDE